MATVDVKVLIYTLHYAKLSRDFTGTE